MVTGPPGAGKSTVARILVEREQPSALVEGDRFFEFLAAGAVEPWLPAARHQNSVVLAAAGAAAGRFAAGGFSTVYDGVLGPWSLAAFGAATGLLELDYAMLVPTADVCVHRVMNRVEHGFRDEAATRKMHREFLGAPIDARHVFAVGDESPDEVATRIAAARATGALAVTLSDRSG